MRQHYDSLWNFSYVGLRSYSICKIAVQCNYYWKSNEYFVLCLFLFNTINFLSYLNNSQEKELKKTNLKNLWFFIRFVYNFFTNFVIFMKWRHENLTVSLYTDDVVVLVIFLLWGYVHIYIYKYMYVHRELYANVYIQTHIYVLLYMIIFS